MNVKQEFLEIGTITIKQEIAFNDSLTEVKKQTVDAFENQQAPSRTTVEVISGFQRTPGKVMFLNSLHDVPESQNSEALASDLFVTLKDLNIIKQEVTGTEYIEPKAELLTDYSDLPNIKSEEFLEEPSTSNHFQYILEQPNYYTPNQNVNCYKYYSSLYLKLKHVNGQFWKRWQACEFCGHFYNKFNYFSHNFNHFVKLNASNLLCYKINQPSILKKHIKPIKSKIRSKQLKKNQSVITNLPAYTDQKPYKCDIFLKEFKIQQSLDNHKIHNEKKPFICEICLKQFTRNTHLKEHLKIHTGEKPFICKICLKGFTRNTHLKEHFRIHTGEKPFICEICAKKFAHTSTLNHHLKVHIDEKPFKCEICSKLFIKNCDLDSHLNIHTGAKPFKCKICLKQFIHKSSLNQHLKLHTDEKPFKCEICLKRFTKKSNLNNHVKIHSGEKPFKCKICSKQFAHKSTLNKHLKIHTGEKPFKCDICFKQFTRNAHLKEHFRIHTGEKPFQCKICSKKFTCKSHLKKHLKIHTS